jgi:soluble lytic murein transglycosylase-like protein
MKLGELRRSLRGGAASLMSATRTGLAAFGVLALAFLAFDGARFIPIHAAQAGSIALGKTKTESVSPHLPVALVASAARDPQQRALADHLARRFRVSADALDEVVREAYAVGEITRLDPLLILAVMAVESSFNPIAESDFGAKGLMQVVPRFHLDKLAAHGGEGAVLEPRINIRVGAQILREYVRQAGGLEEGLQLYAGAADDASQAYAQKVTAEQRRLASVIARVPRPATTT